MSRRTWKLRVHLTRVLIDLRLFDIDVLELEGCDRAVGQDGEGHKSAVAAFQLGVGRHRLDNMPDLLERRHRRAILVSLADRLKYSASEYEIRDL
jgi:hypothetical protein